MDDKTLREVQGVMLGILKDFAEICDKHHLKYWLDSGTCLGAVRHNGFIPWDDDIDVGMLRADYDKFMEIAPKEFGDRYFLQNWYTEDGYGIPFAKMRKNGTLYVEAGSQYAKCHKGVYLDIFAYDRYPEDVASRKKIDHVIDWTRRLILMKNHYTPWLNDNGFSLKRWLAYIPFRFVALFQNKAHLKEAYDRTIQIANKTDSHLAYISGTPAGRNLFMDITIFDEMVKHKFEDAELCIPKRYDEYLTALYGDYMTPPPVDQRANKHNIQKLKL